jgi:hypothetical protein
LGADADQPAVLRCAWQADLARPGTLWVRLTRHDDPTVLLAELLLGSALEGERVCVWSAQLLGFDPSRVPWALSLVVLESHV